jgi:glycerophosphoryl diester phosphodiesterase
MSNISNWESSVPLVIAHRGASAYAPENTIAAFRRAVEVGADAIELDARLSKDGVVLAMHDDTIDRTTDGNGRVRNYTFDELKNFDAGASFSPAFTGERVPSLERILQEFGGTILINIEITDYSSPWTNLPERVIQLVEDFNLTKQVLISSFNPIALMKSRRINHDIKTGLLIHGNEPSIVRNLLMRIVPYDFFHPNDSLMKSSRVGRGSKIIVWTVNNEARMRQLLTMGIAGIITDVPDIAARVRGEFQEGI